MFNELIAAAVIAIGQIEHCWTTDYIVDRSSARIYL